MVTRKTVCQSRLQCYPSEMRISVLVLVLTWIAGSASAQTTLSESEPYQKCIALSKNDGTQALNYSERWVSVEKTPSSLHCRALVLFGQQKFREAAETLDELTLRISNASPRLRLGVYRQNARAWQRAGDHAKAIGKLTDALGVIVPEREDAVMQREQVEILMERAVLYSKSGKPMNGIQDLDQALSLGILSDRVLLTRARIEAANGQKDLAIKDIEAVLRTNPSHHEAQELLKTTIGAK